ncbi:ATPase [Marinobacterium aestuarii]|uniref:ATPase n=1 Tax=Marinobacterium aestuarii TaxID=1821621 RepID=A0A1A9F453_9GAMM|nr:CpaF family protein [Marinobacterium aestuarii]ANG64539.1 ATPase [Marinobacterium aestuarii]
MLASNTDLRLSNNQLDVAPEEENLGLRVSLHANIIERLEEDGLMFEMERFELHPHVQGYVRAYLLEQDIRKSDYDIGQLVAELLDEMVGFGPVQALLDDPAVDDILINGARQVFVERGGLLERVPLRFINDQHVLRVIRRMIAPLGRRIDESSPMVDARLPDGSRINAIIPPLSIDGPCLSIRKFKPEALTIEDLIRGGALNAAMSQFLADCVAGRFNILISGSTGSGKTTLLNILSQNIGRRERVVTIEDAAELQLRNGHVVRLETRPPNSEGQGEVMPRELLKNALRMRPDRIVLGESRGAEVLDMLQAMNTGHQGSMSTVHANSARDSLVRLEMMVTLSGFNASDLLIKQIIATSLDMIIQVARLPDGKRVITDVVEVQDLADGQIRTQPLFRYDAGRDQFESLNGLSVGLSQKQARYRGC